MSDKAGERVTIELDHKQMHMGFHDGIVIPQCYEPVPDHLAKVKNMAIRDDDVMLCSYPKSGTHWMYRVLDMLIRGKVAYDVRNADSTFLDVQDISKMKDLDSPRILITHLPFKYLPDQIKDKRTKLVHVYRNPKAVAVSFYFQMKSTVLGKQNPDMTVDSTANNFIQEKMVPYGGWFSYLDGVSKFQADNPDQSVFHVSYEEMTQKPLDTVKRLAAFLGKPATEEFCSQVVEACSFRNQKETEEKDARQASLKFYRKGDMNDWKNHLTVAASERFDQIVKERAPRCPFSAKY